MKILAHFLLVALAFFGACTNSDISLTFEFNALSFFVCFVSEKTQNQKKEGYYYR
jgi:hypothetical protein